MFQLPELPYAYGSLAPILSEATMRTHHDKHHAKYVATTNALLEGFEPGATLEKVIRSASDKGDHKLFNNAAQAWNHGFFWQCMAPSPRPTSGGLTRAIATNFGGLPELKTIFTKKATEHFGSGWAWLLARGGALSVTTTHDAVTPVTEEGVTPLLTCDVWEHAYYLDHKNDRAGFLDAWWDNLANWSLAEAQFAAANGDGAAWRYPGPT